MDKEVTYDLVAKYFTGNCNESEKQKVESWRDSNSENLLEFDQYRAIWELSKQPENTFSPNVESALNQVNRKLSVKPESNDSLRISLMFKYITRVAAAILVIFGIWLAYTMLRPNRAMLISESGNTRKEVILSDGTHIWLNSKSMLRYPETFKGKTRNIYIEGEAYFEVAKNAKMPFIIETDQSVVTVLGTQFNLRARKNEILTIVTVTEGKVSFVGKKSPTQQSVYLLAGDKGLLNSKNQEMIMEKNQDSNFLSWKTGKLVFKNTPLGKAASDISDYYGVSILIKDSAKINLPITAEFSKQSLSEVLTILELSMRLKVDTTGTEVILK